MTRNVKLDFALAMTLTARSYNIVYFKQVYSVYVYTSLLNHFLIQQDSKCTFKKNKSNTHSKKHNTSQ